MRKAIATLALGIGILGAFGCGPAKGAGDPSSVGDGDGALEHFEHKEARVSITVPKGWKSQNDGKVFSVMTQQEDVAAAFTVVDEDSLGEATKAVGKSLGEKIQNLTFGKEDKIEINGMKGVAVDGDGKMNGVDVDLMIVVLDTPVEGKAMMIIALAEDAKLAAHKAELKFLFQNIKPM